MIFLSWSGQLCATGHKSLPDPHMPTNRTPTFAAAKVNVWRCNNNSPALSTKPYADPLKSSADCKVQHVQQGQLATQSKY